MESKDTVVLKAFKGFLISCLVLFVIQLLKISGNELQIILKEQKFTIIRYLWLDPILFDKETLNVFASEHNISLAGHAAFALFSPIIFVTILLAIVGSLIAYLVNTIRKIVTADSTSMVIQLFFEPVAWVIAWVTINNWSYFGQLFDVIRNVWTLNSTATAIPMKFMIEVIFAYGMIYGFKMIYATILKNTLAFPRYFTEKALGE